MSVMRFVEGQIPSTDKGRFYFSPFLLISFKNKEWVVAL